MFKMDPNETSHKLNWSETLSPVIKFIIGYKFYFFSCFLQSNTTENSESGMEPCAFKRCRLKPGIPKARLREEDIPDLEAFGVNGYKAGMLVCARHFEPNCPLQEKSIRCTGELLHGAFLSPKSLEKMDQGCRLKCPTSSQKNVTLLQSIR